MIECLVVVVVVGILAALILSAVAASREAARRALCMNNLKQIGLALHQYHEINTAFPRGVNGAGYSFIAAILPQLDQAPLYDSINFSISAYIDHAGNETAARTALRVLLCPSDRPGVVGVNYPGNWSSGYEGAPKQGAFAGFDARSVGLEAVVDGASRTVMAAEWLTGVRIFTSVDEHRTVFSMDLTAGNYAGLLEHCRSGPVAPSFRHLNDKGAHWLRGGYTNTLYNHAYKIDERSCTINGSLLDGIFTAGSNHGRGANCLFMDGHVQYIPATVSLAVWRALGSRNGGEVVTEN